MLIAADIIRTMAVTPTFSSVGALVGIMVIRTFISFSLELHWKMALAKGCRANTEGHDSKLSALVASKQSITGSPINLSKIVAIP